MLVRAAHHTHGFPATITRCSNNYGPYQFPEKLIPLMIANARDDKALPVYGDGMQIRDWLYVRDHCEAILAVMEKGTAGEVYNIGGHNEYPNIEIVRSILRHLDKPESIEYVTDRLGHDRRYAIDAKKIDEKLGWTPRYTFEQALPMTIQWYLDNDAWLQNGPLGSLSRLLRRAVRRLIRPSAAALAVGGARIRRGPAAAPPVRVAPGLQGLANRALRARSPNAGEAVAVQIGSILQPRRSMELL